MAITGIDVTERPWAGSADSRLFARDPGPGNPNVGREALRAPATAPTPAAPSVPPPGRLRSAWDAFSGNTKNFVGPQPEALGGVRGAAQSLGRTTLRGAGALGALAVEAPQVAAVATDPDTSGVDVATQVAEGAGKLGTAALGANAGALAGAALGPFGTVAGAALGGAAGYFGGEKLIEGGRRLFGVDPDSPAEQIAARAKTTPQAPQNPSLRVNPDDAFAGPPALAANFAQRPGAQSTTEVTRTGNSYTGGPNIAGDITVNGRAPGGGPVSAQNMQAADALAANQGQASLRRAMAESGSGPSIPGRPNLQAPGNSSNSWQARNDLRNLKVSADSITNRRKWGGPKNGLSMDEQAYLSALNADTAARNGMDPGSVARTNATASMYGDEQRAEATRYASDNSLRGQMATSAASRASDMAKFRYNAAKDDRDYKLRLGEFGMKRQENDRSARAADQEAVSKRLTSMFRTTGKNGEDAPDTQRIGEYTRALEATVGGQIQRLEATGTPEALAKAKELRSRGLAALDDQDHTKFKQLFERRDIARNSKGVLPWKGTYTHSDDLFNYEQNAANPYDKGLLQDQVYLRGGSSVPVNDLRGTTWYGSGTENLDQTKGLRLPR